jgi:hypothetical protein
LKMIAPESQESKEHFKYCIGRILRAAHGQNN